MLYRHRSIASFLLVAHLPSPIPKNRPETKRHQITIDTTRADAWLRLEPGLTPS
jgi:hypothetical protein